MIRDDTIEVDDRKPPVEGGEDFRREGGEAREDFRSSSIAALRAKAQVTTLSHFVCFFVSKQLLLYVLNN